jgi:poly(hydroxyalkanoate) granule-associated protein
MVKKLKQMADRKATQSGVFDSALASSVKESAQQIWLAGMGAFSKAQEEGSKVFEALVKEGVSLQRKTQAVAEEKIGEVTSRMSNMAGDVGSKAGQQWDKLESIFEERVAKSLNKLGVPSAKDVEALIQRIDALSAQVAKLSKANSAPAADKPARRPRAAKSAVPQPTPAAPSRTARKATAKQASGRPEKPTAKAAPKPPVKRARKAASADSGGPTAN